MLVGYRGFDIFDLSTIKCVHSVLLQCWNHFKCRFAEENYFFSLIREKIYEKETVPPGLTL